MVLPVIGFAASVNEPFRQKHLHYGGNAARFLKVFHHIAAARLEIGQQRNPIAHTLKIVDRQLHIDCAGDRNQMQNGVGRAAQYGHQNHRILEGLPCHDISRLEIQFQQLANGFPGTDAFLFFQRILRRR